MTSKRQLSLVEAFGRGNKAIYKRPRIECTDLDSIDSTSDSPEQLVTDQDQSSLE